MTKLDVLRTNIRAGTEALQRLHTRGKEMSEQIAAMDEGEERTILAAECCGIAYGAVFLMSELVKMQQAYEMILAMPSSEAEKYLTDAGFDEPVASTGTQDDFERQLRDMMGL